MGFSEDLASQALAATGGDSATAADWILTHQTKHLNSSPSPTAATHQGSLDRFFPSQNPQPIPNKRYKTQLPSPLSDRMRPRSLSELVGQDHILGPSSLLPSALLSAASAPLPSLLLWGPPGSGKTSLARTLAASLPYRFLTLSAVTAGVNDVRAAIDDARRHRRHSATILFVDEIHRFSKSQQDSFLPAVEDGSIVLLGATTENPSFHVTTPLLSRCRVLLLRPLNPPHIESLLLRAVHDPDRGLPLTVSSPVSVDPDAISFLSLNCDGDARVALNSLEASATLAAARHSQNLETGIITVTLTDVKEAMQCKHLASDRAGEEHYNLISALHKSMRGSDPDAAIYWLARMVEGGEQPLYIARRLVRFASEDVGLADPSALGHAVACYQACHFLGLPECDTCLAQCVAYLALAPKSVAVYRALGEARSAVRRSEGGNESVPLHLRNAPSKLMKEVGYGKGYIYTPDHPDASQDYLPPSLRGRKFLEWPPLEKKPQ